MSLKERIALVIPPSPFLANERVFPSLGILKVASVLEKEGHPVDVLDLSGVSNYEDVVRTYLKKSETGKIGITATTPQFPQAVNIASLIGGFGKKSILGGPHATMVNSARKRGERGAKAYEQMIERFDTVIAGDGEMAIFKAIKEDGLIDVDDANSPMFMKKETLDQYPFPARHLIDLDSYHYEIDDQKAQSVISQLGCPFGCGFCGGRNTPSFRIARTRSIKNIITEIDGLVNLGYEGIMFYDDELNVDNEHLRCLLEALIKYQEKRRVRLLFRGFVRTDLFDQDQADLMYRAGFRMILSGIESGNDRILRTMNKRTTVKKNTLWVETCHNAGLRVKALMSLGHPGESTKTILDSLAWVIENKPDDVDWTIITQYPGSPYFDESVRYKKAWAYTEPRTGLVLYSQNIDYSEKAGYYKGVPGDYTSYVWTDSLSPKDLVRLRDYCDNISRASLGLGRIKSIEAQQFEHSMGQGLAKNILRSTERKDKIK